MFLKYVLDKRHFLLDPSRDTKMSYQQKNIYMKIWYTMVERLTSVTCAQQP